MRRGAIALFCARSALGAAAKTDASTRAPAAARPALAATLSTWSAVGARECPADSQAAAGPQHRRRPLEHSAAAVLQHDHWRRGQLGQRSFAAGPKRSKRVEAALERHGRQQAAAQPAEDVAAATQPDAVAAESGNSVVAAEGAATDSDIESVVGHPGAFAGTLSSAKS